MRVTSRFVAAIAVAAAIASPPILDANGPGAWTPEFAFKVKRVSLVRPLLKVTREETEAYCAAAGIEPIDDESNRSMEYSPPSAKSSARTNAMDESRRRADASGRTFLYRIWRNVRGRFMASMAPR